MTSLTPAEYKLAAERFAACLEDGLRAIGRAPSQGAHAEAAGLDGWAEQARRWLVLWNQSHADARDGDTHFLTSWFSGSGQDRAARPMLATTGPRSGADRPASAPEPTPTVDEIQATKPADEDQRLKWLGVMDATWCGASVPRDGRMLLSATLACGAMVRLRLPVGECASLATAIHGLLSQSAKASGTPSVSGLTPDDGHVPSPLANSNASASGDGPGVTNAPST